MTAQPTIGTASTSIAPVVTAVTAAASAADMHHPTQPHLAKQDASTVDPSKLTALSPEVVCSVL